MVSSLVWIARVDFIGWRPLYFIDDFLLNFHNNGSKIITTLTALFLRFIVSVFEKYVKELCTLHNSTFVTSALIYISKEIFLVTIRGRK